MFSIEHNLEIDIFNQLSDKLGGELRPQLWGHLELLGWDIYNQTSNLLDNLLDEQHDQLMEHLQGLGNV